MHSIFKILFEVNTLQWLWKNTKARFLNYERRVKVMTGKPGMKGSGLGGARPGAGRPKKLDGALPGKDVGRLPGAVDKLSWWRCCSTWCCQRKMHVNRDAN